MFLSRFSSLPSFTPFLLLFYVFFSSLPRSLFYQLSKWKALHVPLLPPQLCMFSIWHQVSRLPNQVSKSELAARVLSLPLLLRHLVRAALGTGLAQCLSACQSLRLARSWRTCIIQETALCLLPKQDTHDLNCLRKFRSSGLDSALHLMWQLCADFRNLNEPKTRIRNRNIKNKVKSTKTYKSISIRTDSQPASRIYICT